jgi:hypothetical protein
MQRETEEKTRNVLERDYRSIALCNDLPRLSKNIEIDVDGRVQFFFFFCFLIHGLSLLLRRDCFLTTCLDLFLIIWFISVWSFAIIELNLYEDLFVTFGAME